MLTRLYRPFASARCCVVEAQPVRSKPDRLAHSVASGERHLVTLVRRLKRKTQFHEVIRVGYVGYGMLSASLHVC